MTKEELIKELEKWHFSPDPELSHREAEKLLLEFIDDEKVTEAFDKVPAWYA